jgi:hypothetical protein
LACLRRWSAGVALAVLAAAAAAQTASATYDPDDFKRERIRTDFWREVQFRAAALQVAWSAEPLCDATTEIEPFVLWSFGALGRDLSAAERKLFSEVTSMDDAWRVVWADEGAPDELRLGDAVTAVNGRKLPAGGSRWDLSALFRLSSPVSGDDQGFWDVVLKAREEAQAGKPMTVTLADGRTLKVETQTGCAGSVVATGFDHEPARLWRSGSQRVKIPANAMLEARSRDEARWLAAFGTYFQATEKAIGRAQDSGNVSSAFVVGKILSITVPGAGMLLTALEQQADRTIAVDSIVGGADLFANEVVTAMGGDPTAGVRFNERLAELGLKVDVVQMTEFRLANAKEHAARLVAMQAARTKVEAAAEADQRRAQDAAQPPR